MSLPDRNINRGMGPAKEPSAGTARGDEIDF